MKLNFQILKAVRNPFFLSVLFHLSLLVFLIFSVQSPKSPPKPNPIQITIEERVRPSPPLSKATSSGNASSGSQSLKKKFTKKFKTTQPQIALKNLGVHFGDLSLISPSQNAATEGAPSRVQSAREGDLLNGTGYTASEEGVAALNKNISLHQHVYKRIENNLTYPEEFVEKKIQGEVVVKLCLDEKGDYDRSRSVVQAPDPYLKVYVARMLRRTFEEGIPPMFLTNPKVRFLNLSFHFQFVHRGDADQDRQQNMIVGDNLFFYRTIHRSTVEWDLGPFSGIGPTVGFNPVWVVEKGLDLFSNKAKTDPFQKYRDDPEW